MDAGFAVTADIDERADLRLQRRIDVVAGVLDLLQLALDRLDARFGGFRLGAAFGEFLLELLDQSVVLARQFLHARGLLLGEGTRGRVKLVKLALEVVGDVGRRDRRDEGEALGLRQFGRGRFQLW